MADTDGWKQLVEAVNDLEGTAAEHVRRVLVLARERAWPFEVAWDRALSSLPRCTEDSPAEVRNERREQVRMLLWSRASYQAFYEGSRYGAVHLSEEATRLDVLSPELAA